MRKIVVIVGLLAAMSCQVWAQERADNGEDWMKLSRAQKVFVVYGAMVATDSLLLLANYRNWELDNVSAGAGDLSVGQIVSQLDEFYQEPANREMPLNLAFMHFFIRPDEASFIEMVYDETGRVIRMPSAKAKNGT